MPARRTLAFAVLAALAYAGFGLSAWRLKSAPPEAPPPPAGPTAATVSLASLHPDRQHVARASGFYVPCPRGVLRGGVLITCSHAVAAGGVDFLAVARSDGRSVPASRLLTDPAGDLAAWITEEPAPAAIPLSDREPATGERLRVVDAHSAVETTALGMGHDERLGRVLLLAAAPGLGPGSSGAAVVDAAGKAVAVLWGATEDERTLGAIPAARAAALVAGMDVPPPAATRPIGPP